MTMIDLIEPESATNKGKGPKIVDDKAIGTLRERSKLRKLHLIWKLSDWWPERLDYLTSPLLKFWKKFGFVSVYRRLTAKDLTEERWCIMLKMLISVSVVDEACSHDRWLSMASVLPSSGAT